MSGALINGLVIIEPALGGPVCLVTAKTLRPQRTRGRFFAEIAEARTFARELAEKRGLLLLDLVAAAEGEAA